ncbi:patatin-like phospholipase domain-containing protein 7 isoform X2 [Paramacrobiotus metropolitanus]|uniref:patatin-like phospholipase domain-containing protein 7 isoform X2 n=1 Tax=Paramacrobiotus metropolitanus TaxID=2943436 RepID=UPI00244659BF|nr:patatin-like phospholipase domain-containing protein 7 isoform X2 [Paramacrobiotus metropolitanus]
MLDTETCSSGGSPAAPWTREGSCSADGAGSWLTSCSGVWCVFVYVPLLILTGWVMWWVARGMTILWIRIRGKVSLGLKNDPAEEPPVSGPSKEEAREGRREARVAGGSGGMGKKFPKKEKVRFYYNKVLHRVNSWRYADSPGGKQRLKTRQIVRKFADNLLNRVKLKGRFRRRGSESSAPRLLQKELPASYLEEQAGAVSGRLNAALPSEVLSMMRAIRVFGHLDEAVFLELCQQMASVTIEPGDFLFRPGDPDDCVYMVQRGRLLVFIYDQDTKRELPLKEVKTGESIASMLSILDVLSGHQHPFKTVTCRAIEESLVIRMPVTAFGGVLERSPESLVRVVQLIMTRLQRVTFSALRDYLGLTHELMKSDKHGGLTPLEPVPAVRNTPGNLANQAHMTPAHGVHAQSVDETGKHFRSQSIVTLPWKVSVPVPLSPPATTDGAAPPPWAFTSGRPPLPVRSLDDDFARKLQYSLSIKEPDKMTPSRRPLGRSVSVVEEAHLPEDDDFERARRDLVELLGLKSVAVLEDRMVYKRVPSGMYLVHEFDQDSSLYYIVSGCLSVSQKSLDRTDKNAHLFVAVKGELVGTLAVLTGEPSMFNIRAKTVSRILMITRADYFELLREYPQIALSTAHSFVKRMTPFVRQIDFALDWEQVESGHAIFRQNDEADCVYVILNGRMRAVVRKTDGSKEATGEYARGDLVGLTEVSVHKPRMTTVIAVRDSEIAKIPTHVLEYIKLKYPKVVTRLIHILGDRVFHQMQSRLAGAPVATVTATGDPAMAPSNLTTVAVLAVNGDVPLDAFCLELDWSLQQLGTTLRLTSRFVEQLLGAAALEPVNEYRLATWLGIQEDSHRMVLFQCDESMTTWTRQSLRQADCILIVANGDKQPTIGNLEKQLDVMDLRAEKRLVLLHRPDAVIPKNTADWLNIRGWLSAHHHIKCPKRLFLRKPATWFEEYYEQKRTAIPDKFSDFSRLARILMGKSIGLVLGGGGARGAAHVGVIRAMLEAGVPIDMVGGTSIGSFMGALWCEERNLTRFVQRARAWSMGMMSLWKRIIDLTYPYTSMFKGTTFNEAIEATFKDRQIEDLWIPYFNITTDITASAMRVHKAGSLWRYVRASMSLSGYLPPLCDPEDGHLLLDGGYVNNLPADVMQQQGVNYIVAVDVGSQDDHNLTNYGDELSGWWLLWKKLNPFATPVRVPNMAEVQTRLAFVSCVRTLEMVKKSDYCVYVRPPIESFKTLEFNKFDLIASLGYDYGRNFFGEDKIRLKVEELFTREVRRCAGVGTVHSVKETAEHAAAGALPGFQYSFTDLAQIVSQMKSSTASLSESGEMSSSSKEEDEELDEVDAEDAAAEDTEEAEERASSAGDGLEKTEE